MTKELTRNAFRQLSKKGLKEKARKLSLDENSGRRPGKGASSSITESGMCTSVERELNVDLRLAKVYEIPNCNAR